MRTSPQKFKSFRNIATCNPSQNLFDDIAPAKDFALLQNHEAKSSNIDHALNKTMRPFQYGDSRLSVYVFDKLNWRRGRFSDGQSYGVWYGALAEVTSQKETLYHLVLDDQDLWQNPKIVDDVIVHQRKMLKAACSGKRFLDLRQTSDLYAKLTANDYEFCQKFAAAQRQAGVDGFLTPAARHRDGVCTPIFNPEAIVKDEFLYYFDFLIYRQGEQELKKVTIEKIAVG